MLRVSFGRGKRALALGAFTAWVVALACSTGQDSVQRTDPTATGGDLGAGGDMTPSAGTNNPIGGSINLDSGATFGDTVAIAFNPPSVTLMLDGVMPGEASYELIATDEDGDMRVVTAEAMQFDRPDLASMQAGSPVVLTSPGSVAGTGQLFAVYNGMEASATLEVQIIQQAVVGTVDPGVIDALNADNLAADPLLTTLLYPYDQTVFPLGLTSPLIMWDAPAPAGDVYRLRLQQGNYTYDHFETVTAPAQVRIDQLAWDRVTASNTGDPLTLTVSRYDTVGAAAYTSAQVGFTIAPESLRGSIYYWTASGDGVERVGSIQRIAPGTGAMPEALNEGRCMGCHSVSADGSTLVATIEDATAPSLPPYEHPFQVDGVRTRPWAAFDLPAGDLSLQTTKHGANSALTHDGSYVVFGGPSYTIATGDVGLEPGSKYLSLAPTATGEVIATSGLDLLVPGTPGHQFLMPAFSPDNPSTKLVMVEAKVDDAWDNVLPSDQVAPAALARIVYIEFDQATGTFNPTLHEVARADAFDPTNNGIGYPAFTADSEWVGFHTGEYPTGCHPVVNGCVDATPDAGELWIAKADGTQLIRLDNANDPPVVADQKVNREPTFNPEKRGGYSWMVFTSMRNWGNNPNVTGPAINGKRRLWVAAVDSEIGTTDPSHPAFYIEGQDDATPNMRGFWALSECVPSPGECGAGFECCSGFCVEGVCSEPVGLTCVGAGEACVESTDCCNYPQVQCISGICQVEPPPK